MSEQVVEVPTLTEDCETHLTIEINLLYGRPYARVAEVVSGSTSDRAGDNLGELIDKCLAWAGITVRSFEGVTDVSQVVERIKSWGNPDLTVEISQRFL